MKNEKLSFNEFFYFLILGVTSLLCSILIGFEFIESYSERFPERLNEANVLPLVSMNDESNLLSSELKMFYYGGRLYENSENGNAFLNLNRSNFYNVFISSIPTSVYWKFPLNNNLSSLQFYENNGIRIINLKTDIQNSLPVLSLIVNSDDFFSYSNGIYVQGYDSDFQSSPKFYPMPWHKPANFYRKENDKRKVFFSYYDEKGKPVYSSYAYAEISGKATRSFPQKSIRLTADKVIGKSKFEYDFFNEGTNYTSLVLRNGGNDNSKAMIRDMFMQSLMNKSGLMVSGFVPCEVYLNGEYWGIHFLQNRLDVDFLAKHFNCKKKNITIVENWQPDKGNEIEYKKLMSLIKNKNTTYGELEREIDMKSLALYLAAQMFFANTDWPENNLKMFRAKSRKTDSKWRFAFFDLDYGCGYTGVDAFSMDMFAYLENGTDPFRNMYKKLIKEEKFKVLFKQAINEVNNNFCSTENIKNYLSYCTLSISKGMKFHIERWGRPDSMDKWEEEVEIIRDFTIKRKDVVIQQMKKYFN